jgi:hypothetical protein
VNRIDRPAGLIARADARLAGFRRLLRQPATRRQLHAINAVSVVIATGLAYLLARILAGP